ncbi:Transposon Ty3-I Gag-Pol polyprotein [Gossypium australe]|uniref:Transposon Ty3-I Gag-Pol polyprotein n=1 Tax=Gossypium australe TaxID=47621 RepID=A0A5B6U3M8_9ROSI|nr:Transposon Ty3-I Gag-Pol polyprotein [Gossypium australe]
MERSPEPKIGRKPMRGNSSNQNKNTINPNDHTVCGRRLNRIEGKMQSMRTDVKQVQSECTNSTKPLTKLENQMSQLMSMMKDIKRQIGIGIPNNTENNPCREGKEHRPLEANNEPKSDEIVAPAIEPEVETTKDPAVAKIPFSSRLEENFLNLFKTLNVNLPLIELIEKVPKYAEFLKEIMPKHRKINVGEQVSISISYSVIISRQVTQKLKDPGSFTISIEIGSTHFNRALCELGTSINLIPLSIFEKLGSSAYPKEVLEDVLVKVCSFIISTNFVVLDFEEDREIPILLGRPFLAT